MSSSLNFTQTETTLLLSSITTSASEPVSTYDYQGAALYIAVILIWYSTGLAMMLFLQIRPRTLHEQFFYDSSDSSKKIRNQSVTKNPFTDYRKVQADNTTKQILNELKDPEKRQRLWKIYYSSTEKQNEPYPQYYQTITTDNAAIDRIKRKLADIHRMNATNDDSILPSPSVPTTAAGTNDNRLSTLSNFDSTKFFSKRLSSIRRSNVSTTSTAGTRPPPIIRVRSQTDAPSDNVTVEMEPLVNQKQSFNSSTDNSPNEIDTITNRFIIEKVSDANPDSANVNQNNQ